MVDSPGTVPAPQLSAVNAQQQCSPLLDLEEPLAVSDGLAVSDQDLEQGAIGFGLDLVHYLHGLDNADDRVLHDLGTRVGKGLTFGRGGPVERSYHWRFDIAHARFIGSRVPGDWLGPADGCRNDAR